MGMMPRMKAGRILVTLIVAGIAVGLALLVRHGCSSDDKFVADRSTPQAAALTLYNAIDKLNAAEVRASFAADADANCVKAHVDIVEAFDAMKKAAAEKYSNDVARQIGGTVFTNLDHIKYAAVKENAGHDRATLKSVDGSEIELKKESTQWKVAAQATTQPSPNVLATIAAGFHDTAKKIRDGNYSVDKEEAIKAIRRDLQAARDRALNSAAQ